MKKQLWTRMLAVLLCIVMILAGCGKKKESGGSSTESPDSSKGSGLQSFRICFDEADCTVSDIEYDATTGMLKYVNATGTDGKSIKLYCSNVYVVDGMITMYPSSYMANAIGLPGIDHIEFESLSSYMDGIVTCGLTNDYAQLIRDGIMEADCFPMSGTASFEIDVEKNTQITFSSDSYHYFAVGAAMEGAMWRCHSITVYYKAGDLLTTETGDRTPNKYMTVSASGDHVAELTMNGNYVESLVTLDQDGNRIEWLCKDLEVQSDGRFCLHKGGYFFNKTPIQGLCNVSYTGNENQGNEDAYHMQTGLIAYTSDIRSIDDVMWALPHYAFEDMPFNELMGYLSYYCMDALYGDITFASFTLGYMDEGFTGLSKAILNTEKYGNYAEGQFYDPTREHYDPAARDLTFNIVIIPDTDEADVDNGSCSYTIPMDRITVGDLYDVHGNVKSKNEPLRVGDQLMLTVAGCDLMMRLPVYPEAGYSTLKEARGREILTGVGQKNILVIPIYMSNQADRATQDGIEGIQIACGRVIDSYGNVTDYSGEHYSLSQYYDIASYGQLTLNSFITDWYCVEDLEFGPMTSGELPVEQVQNLTQRVNADYADVLPLFDGDGDDIFDGVIIICAFSGDSDEAPRGYQSILAYDPDTMSDDGILNIATYCYINEARVFDNVDTRDLSGVHAETLIHEFGHSLGLIDYYDLSSVGIDAIGGYDMQGSSVGDWNPYSKYAVGWTVPTIVSAKNMESDSVTVSLRPFATSGDFLIIPTENTRYNDDGTISPFSEYLLFEYFTPEGVNDRYAKSYGLGNVHGIRVLHVSANMMDIPGIDTDGLEHVRHENGESNHYPADLLKPIGIECYNNSYNVAGCYNIQVIQKGGHNTFTLAEYYDYRLLTPEDLFYKGDTFQIENYTEFFNGGVMNDRSEFPYTITVKSISDTEAVIEIQK